METRHRTGYQDTAILPPDEMKAETEQNRQRETDRYAAYKDIERLIVENICPVYKSGYLKSLVCFIWQGFSISLADPSHSIRYGNPFCFIYHVMGNMTQSLQSTLIHSSILIYDFCVQFQFKKMVPIISHSVKALFLFFLSSSRGWGCYCCIVCCYLSACKNEHV